MPPPAPSCNVPASIRSAARIRVISGERQRAAARNQQARIAARLAQGTGDCARLAGSDIEGLRAAGGHRDRQPAADAQVQLAGVFPIAPLFQLITRVSAGWSPGALTVDPAEIVCARIMPPLFRFNVA